MAVGVYLNALRNPFLYDDFHTVVANPSLTGPLTLRSALLYDATRPLVNLSFVVDRALWGAGPFGFHLTNVLLHAANVALLFQFTWLATASVTGATIAAALLAVHPMMAEAVGYISGRYEVLCATFFLAALLSGRRWLQGARGFAAPTCALWLCAAASKETGAMFPFVFLCYDWLAGPDPDPERRRRRLVTIHGPLLGIAVIAGVLRVAVLARIEHPGAVGIHWPYVMVAADAVREYVALLLFPTGQAMFHEPLAADWLFGARAFIAVAVVALLAVAAWRLRRLDGRMTFGIAWFLLLLVPSSVLIMLDRGEPIAEHRVYLASCGLFFAGGLVADHVAAAIGGTLKTAALATAAIVIASLGFETLLRNAVFHDPVAVWRESVALAPNHHRPRLLLGEALEDAGNRRAALDQYETAARLRPRDPEVHLKLGACLAALGRIDEAKASLREAVALDPASEPARRMLALVNRMDSAR